MMTSARLADWPNWMPCKVFVSITSSARIQQEVEENRIAFNLRCIQSWLTSTGEEMDAWAQIQIAQELIMTASKKYKGKHPTVDQLLQ